ncbi:hypothetical protein AAFC00_006116 [Neodothiora populina]|uniref:Maintenance of telomere capping protein 1 n=1 Tax=Neodothiora populina TaxID=2781224 RepID=A0ABR3P4F0_9PEZI
MSHKKPPTNEDLFAALDELPSEDTPAVASSTTPRPDAAAAPTSSSLSPPPAAPVPDDDDPLAELSALAAARPTSRPGTPRHSSATTSSTSTKRAEHTPASSGPPSNRTSEDRLRAVAPSAPRKSTESSRSALNHSFIAEDKNESATATATAAGTDDTSHHTPEQPAASSGGGWWGSVFNVASAAVKQAEAAVKEIRGNEEVLKYAEQVKGNAKLLREYGGNVRSLALPTFHSLIQTIAPPISAHERLQIHITHDIQGYPSLDPLIYSVFARVMSQVEGGDLLVIQRGSESRARSVSDAAYKGSVLGGNSGWTDGPWWRDENQIRDIAAIRGVVEGTKLARANAEAYANDFFASRGGIEEAAKQATQVLSESNPVRSSDIFLAIQAITIAGDKSLFQGSPLKKDDADATVPTPEEEIEDTTAFAIFLHDPIHSLSFSALSQSFPAKWSAWLDESSAGPDALPESIREIVESGGIDPREWTAEWMEETLSLSIGIIAQRYVAKRMGVGEGGLGHGKAKERADEAAAAGEAARAL